MTNTFDAFIVFICAMLVCLMGCGSLKVSGGTTHKVEGTAEIVQRITIDIDICKGITDETRRAKCIEDVLDILETITPPSNVNGSL